MAALQLSEVAHLGKGEVAVAVGVELLEELPALLLGLVGALEGQLLVDGRPVDVGGGGAHLAAGGGVVVGAAAAGAGGGGGLLDAGRRRASCRENGRERLQG